MQHQKRDEQRRQHAGMQGEKPRQRGMAIRRTADDQLLQLLADHRHQAHQIGRHAGGPKAFLIPGQQIAGERQPEHDLHQHQAEPEIDFARRR